MLVKSRSIPADHKHTLENSKEELAQMFFEYFRASYMYYVLFRESGMSDEEYDKLCKTLLDNFDNISKRLSCYLDKESLKAGTGYGIERETYSKVATIFLRAYGDVLYK